MRNKKKKIWLRERGQEMKACPTKAEFKMRGILKRYNIVFSEQKPYKGRILDFYLNIIKAVVEVDGPYHYTPAQQEADRIRDAQIGRGLAVIHFPNEIVFSDENYVAEKIAMAVVKRAHKYTKLSATGKRNFIKQCLTLTLPDKIQKKLYGDLSTVLPAFVCVEEQTTSTTVP